MIGDWEQEHMNDYLNLENHNHCEALKIFFKDLAMNSQFSLRQCSGNEVLFYISKRL